MLFNYTGLECSPRQDEEYSIAESLYEEGILDCIKSLSIEYHGIMLAIAEPDSDFMIPKGICVDCDIEFANKMELRLLEIIESNLGYLTDKPRSYIRIRSIESNSAKEYFNTRTEVYLMDGLIYTED